jgi:hypothetical protein
MPRRSRASETREATQRPEVEANFSAALYFPRHRWPKGMTCRWVRVGVREVPDNENWAKAIRSGWMPLPLEHCQEYAIPSHDGTPQTQGVARIGNHILCFKPTKDVANDRLAQQERTRDQARALDEYVRDNGDADHPRFNRSGKTEYGVGRQMTAEQAFKEE